MIISFADNFSLAFVYHTTDLSDEFGRPFFGLVKPSTRNRKRNFKARIFLHIFFKEIKHRSIRFIGDFSKNSLVGLAAIIMIMEIIRIVADIKNRIFAIADWLMNMWVVLR